MAPVVDVVTTTKPNQAALRRVACPAGRALGRVLRATHPTVGFADAGGVCLIVYIYVDVSVLQVSARRLTVNVVNVVTINVCLSAEIRNQKRVRAGRENSPIT